ncbi:MAG: HAD family hydrolase [Bacilli bacterium]
MDWKGKKVFIFDMDGTLYEGRKQYDHYAKRIAMDLDEHIRNPFWEDYSKIMDHQHAMKIGMIYDISRDVGIEVHPVTIQALKVTNWDGEQWTEEQILEAYGTERVAVDDKILFSVGDAWWVPFMVAAHYGNPQSAFGHYLTTKDHFNKGESAYELPERIVETLEKLRATHTLVCMTNSEEKDMVATLQALGLGGVFHFYIPSAKKPIRTVEHLQEIATNLNCNFSEMVSVGDNYINEIAPALEIGMEAIHIWPYEETKVIDRLWRVSSLGAFTALVNEELDTKNSKNNTM